MKKRVLKIDTLRIENHCIRHLITLSNSFENFLRKNKPALREIYNIGTKIKNPSPNSNLTPNLTSNDPS